MERRDSHAKIVQAFADVKDNSDSGQFMAIQQAAKAALEHPEIGDRVREKYRRRLRQLVAALGKVGFTAKMPGGTYFLYAKAPTGCGELLLGRGAEAVLRVDQAEDGTGHQRGD